MIRYSLSLANLKNSGFIRINIVSAAINAKCKNKNVKRQRKNKNEFKTLVYKFKRARIILDFGL